MEVLEKPTYDLYLHHGRRSPDEKLEDWGFDGPRLKGCIGIHQTYRSGPNVYFIDRSAMLAAKNQTGWVEWDSNALTMRWFDDLVEAQAENENAPSYYGDWGLMPTTET